MNYDTEILINISEDSGWVLAKLTARLSPPPKPDSFNNLGRKSQQLHPRSCGCTTEGQRTYMHTPHTGSQATNKISGCTWVCAVVMGVTEKTQEKGDKRCPISRNFKYSGQTGFTEWNTKLWTKKEIKERIMEDDGVCC